MFLDDMADYLTSGGVSGSVFAGFMPEKPDAATCVYEPPGQPSVHTMGRTPGQAVVTRPMLQVVCRDAAYGYEAAAAKAQSAFALLDGLHERVINGATYKLVTARQPPFLLKRDESGRVYIGCNYDVMKG